MCVSRTIGVCAQVMALLRCSKGRLLEVCGLFSTPQGNSGGYYCCLAWRQFVSTHLTLPQGMCWIPLPIARQTPLDLSITTAQRIGRSPNLWFTKLVPVGGLCVVVCLQAYYELQSARNWRFVAVTSQKFTTSVSIVILRPSIGEVHSQICFCWANLSHRISCQVSDKIYFWDFVTWHNINHR